MADGKTPAEELRDFYSTPSSFGGRDFGSLSAEEAHRVLQVVLENLSAVDDLVKFVKVRDWAARKLTVEDIQSVIDEQSVERIMNS